MKLSGGIEEEGIVVGNTYDKYGSKNPLVKYMMGQFHDALDQLVSIADPESIHEVGCGEGFLVMEWMESGIRARGSDFSRKVIDIAKKNACTRNLSSDSFCQKSIYDLERDTDGADLVVCCEVLEHLEDPAGALSVLQTVVGKHLIVSVPREPVWRILNMARGRYLKDWGNTPGHIQHWSKTSFTSLIGQYFEILEIKSPFPWTMLLCRPVVRE